MAVGVMKFRILTALIAVGWITLTACQNPYLKKDELPPEFRMVQGNGMVLVGGYLRNRPARNSKFIPDEILDRNIGKLFPIIGEIQKEEGTYSAILIPGDGYFFISKNSLRVYTSSKQFILPEGKAKKLRTGEFNILGKTDGTIFSGMECMNSFGFIGNDPDYPSNFDFSKDLILPAYWGDGHTRVLLIRSTSFENSRQQWENKFPRRDLMFCGTMVDRQYEKNVHGFIREVPIYRIDYILYNWWGIMIVFPRQ